LSLFYGLGLQAFPTLVHLSIASNPADPHSPHPIITAQASIANRISGMVWAARIHVLDPLLIAREVGDG